MSGEFAATGFIREEFPFPSKLNILLFAIFRLHWALALVDIAKDGYPTHLLAMSTEKFLHLYRWRHR